MSQTMLYPHPLAQTLSARRRLHPFAQPMLKLLILGNRHRAAMAWRSRCALRTQGAGVALLRIKFDHSPESKSSFQKWW
jgi:hypothetical protein